MSGRVIGEFFDAYSANWTIVKDKLKPRIIVEPDIDGIFVCPLCFKYFQRDSLSTLSLEHVPPRGVGGQVQTMTCRDCNSVHGSKLDSHLVKKMDYIAAFTGKSSSAIRAKVTINREVTLPANFYPALDGKIVLCPAEGQGETNKPQVESFTQQFALENAQIDIQMLVPIDRYADMSLLRAAYLWMFSAFGYGYLFNLALHGVRTQINRYSETLLPTLGVFRYDFPDEVLGINIVTAPYEIRSFLVVFDVRSKNSPSIRHGVLLPGHTQPGIQIYKSLSQNEKQLFKMELFHLADEAKPDFNAYPLASQDIWEHCNGQ